MSTAALAAQVVILPQPVDLRFLGQADVAQDVRRAVPERDQLPMITRAEEPGPQLAEPACGARLA